MRMAVRKQFSIKVIELWTEGGFKKNDWTFFSFGSGFSGGCIEYSQGQEQRHSQGDFKVILLLSQKKLL